MLAVAGNALGALAAIWITQAAAARITTPFSHVSYAVDVRPDLRVLAFTMLGTGLTAVLCGLSPIRYAAHDLNEVLKARRDEPGAFLDTR